ncbi:MAG TPA: sialidase family protein [Dehalococcoidia bacterium]|nr:sialidase family protein [Dehalococcoidia bacterium]
MTSHCRLPAVLAALLLVGFLGTVTRDVGASSIDPPPPAAYPLDAQADTDGDLLPDTTEIACGSDPQDPASIPERLDLPGDDDRDGLSNEPLPPAAGALDCDGDGYTGSAESSIFAPATAADQYPCGPDGWPSDLFSAPPGDNRVTVLDLTSFLAPVRRLNTNPGDSGFSRRWDLTPGAGAFPSDINLSDMTALLAGPTAFPPILAGARALGGPPCPWPPSSAPAYEVVDTAVYEKTQYDQRPLHILPDGARYVVIPSDWGPIGLRMLSRPESGSGWTELDAAGRPDDEDQITGVSSAVDARGVIHVTWLRKSPGPLAVRYTTFDTNAGLWATPEDVTTTGLADSFLVKASITVGPDGVPRIAFGGEGGAVYYTERVSGNWSTPEPILEPPLTAANVTIYADGLGRVHAVMGSAAIYYRRRTDQGWGPLETVSTTAAPTNTGYPVFAANPSGDILVGYWDNPDGLGGDWNLKARQRSADGAWSDPTIIMANTWGGSVEWGADLSFVGGRWVAAWVHDYNRLFYSVSTDGSTWSTPTQVLPERDGWAWARLPFGLFETLGSDLELLCQRAGTTDSPFELGWYRAPLTP